MNQLTHNAYTSNTGSLQTTRYASAPANGTSQQGTNINVTSGQVDQYSPSNPSDNPGIYNPRMLAQNGNQGGRTLATPTVRDGNTTNGANATATAYSDMKPEEKRTAFMSRMKEAGVTASNPPTEEELKKYFGTFNDPKKRAQAAGQFQDYVSAFHVHEANSDRPGDVRYSGETSHTVNGKVFTKEEDAQKEANKVRKDYLSVPTFDASNWNDVARQPKNREDGRHIQDCEGYAYMAGSLLGAAGYKPTQVATGPSDNAHAMTVLKDPSGGNSVVVSNDKTFSGKNENALLTDGWEYASGGTSNPGTFHRGNSQAEAQTRLMAAEDAASSK